MTAQTVAQAWSSQMKCNVPGCQDEAVVAVESYDGVEIRYCLRDALALELARENPSRFHVAAGADARWLRRLFGAEAAEATA